MNIDINKVMFIVFIGVECVFSFVTFSCFVACFVNLYNLLFCVLFMNNVCLYGCSILFSVFLFIDVIGLFIVFFILY